MGHYSKQYEEFQASLASARKPRYRSESFGGGYTIYMAKDARTQDFITHGGKVIHSGSRAYIARVYARLHDEYFGLK